MTAKKPKPAQARKTKPKPTEWRDFDWASVEDDGVTALGDLMDDMFPVGAEVSIRFRDLNEDDLDNELGELEDGNAGGLAEFKCPSVVLPYVVLDLELSGIVGPRTSYSDGFGTDRQVPITLGVDENDDDVTLYVPLNLIKSVKGSVSHLPEPNCVESIPGITFEVKEWDRRTVWMCGTPIPLEQACALLTVVSIIRGFYFEGPVADLYFADDGGPTYKAQSAYDDFACEYEVEFTPSALKVGCNSIMWSDINDVIDALGKLIGWM
jgi:hypothetical protein